jgi:hypothetical protein
MTGWTSLPTACSIERDQAYVSGLMHDIGRLALATVEPVAYKKLLDEAQQGISTSWVAKKNSSEWTSRSGQMAGGTMEPPNGWRTRQTRSGGPLR